MFNFSLNSYNIVLGIYFLFIGLCIGSFLNVVALRSLADEEFIFTPSKCPKCNNKIKWYDNIPVLSYILLMGKCRFCKCKISPQYPIVELGTALIFLCTFMKFGISFKTFFIILYACFAILIIITDIKERVVMDYHTYPLILLGIIYNTYGLGSGILYSILGAIGGFIIFEILAKTGYLFANSRAFGEGDSIVVGGLGAIFGIKMLIIVLIAAVILQIVIMIPSIIFKKFKANDKKGGYLYIATAILLAICTGLYCIDIYKYDFCLIIMLPVLLSLVWCAFKILMSVKHAQPDDISYYPFAPALVISGLIMLFL